ncbi:hypothetical protein WMF39_09935 [Sorangium sp. So ce1504]|uniref:hypothetical protein n=1 Tax=unclassified Sorangium TaxID=2621164 RepID=UPI003F648EF9
MSDETRCDVCGEAGRRRHGRLCPVGWLYGVAGVDECVASVDPHCLEETFRAPGPCDFCQARSSTAWSVLPAVADDHVPPAARVLWACGQACVGRLSCVDGVREASRGLGPCDFCGAALAAEWLAFPTQHHEQDPPEVRVLSICGVHGPRVFWRRGPGRRGAPLRRPAEGEVAGTVEQPHLAAASWRELQPRRWDGLRRPQPGLWPRRTQPG